MATLHLLHGFIGAGKTTFARKLAAQTGALHLNSDAWVVPLFGHNPKGGNFDETVRKIEDLQWQVALHVLKLGGDVVIDYGFWTRAKRDAWRAIIKEHQLNSQWYTATTDYATMRARAMRRNENLAPDEMMIEPNTFDVLWPLFQPLGPDEPAIPF